MALGAMYKHYCNKQLALKAPYSNNRW